MIWKILADHDVTYYKEYTLYSMCMLHLSIDPSLHPYEYIFQDLGLDTTQEYNQWHGDLKYFLVHIENYLRPVESRTISYTTNYNNDGEILHES